MYKIIYRTRTKDKKAKKVVRELTTLELSENHTAKGTLLPQGLVRALPSEHDGITGS